MSTAKCSLRSAISYSKSGATKIPAIIVKLCAGANMRVARAMMRTRPLPGAVSRVAPGNPYAFPRIRIWRGRRVLTTPV
jgi:hypothetical protein